MTCPSEVRPCTTAAGHGVNSDPTHGAVMPPLYLSSNFSFDGLEGKRRYDYTRADNRTRDGLAYALAQLEGGCGAVWSRSRGWRRSTGPSVLWSRATC